MHLQNKEEQVKRRVTLSKEKDDILVDYFMSNKAICSFLSEVAEAAAEQLQNTKTITITIKLRN